jgi:hypothetical protein
MAKSAVDAASTQRDASSTEQVTQRLKRELDDLTSRYNSVKDEIGSAETVLQDRRRSGVLIGLAVFLAIGGWMALTNGMATRGVYNWWAIGPVFIAILIFRSGLSRAPRGRHTRRMLREAYYRMAVLKDQIRKKNLELENHLKTVRS